TAYGMAYHGGLLFPFVAVATFLPFLVLPAALGTVFTVLLVNVFPARRTRELLGLVAISGVAVVVLLLRFIRPEQLARPEGFRSFVDYLAVLRTPTSPWLPSAWASPASSWPRWRPASYFRASRSRDARCGCSARARSTRRRCSGANTGSAPRRCWCWRCSSRCSPITCSR